MNSIVIKQISSIIPDNYEINNDLNTYTNLIEFIKLLQPYNTKIVWNINGKKWKEITKLLTNKKSYDISKNIINFLYSPINTKIVSRLSKTLNLLPIIKYKPTNFSNIFNFTKYQLFLQDKKENELKTLFPIIGLNKSINIKDKINLNDLTSDTLFYYLYYISTKTLEELNNCLLLFNKSIISETDTEDDIIKKKNVFVKKKIEILTHIIKFHTYIQYYFYIYKQWKEKDRVSSVETLIKNFWEIEITIQEILKSVKMDDEQKQNTIETLKRQQREIEFFTERIGGPDSLIKLKQSLPILFDESFTDNIKDTLQLVYWDNIKNDIINDNNYQKFKDVIQEMIVILQMVNTSDEFKTELESYLDVEFIINLINNKVYSLRECQKVNTYFFELTKKYDAPVYDNQNNESYEIITNQLIEITEIMEKSKTDLTDTKHYFTYIISMISIIINHYYQIFKRIAQQKIDFLKSLHK